MRYIFVFAMAFSFLWISGCSKKITTVKTSRTLAEEPYCTLRASFSDAVTLTGSASFDYRSVVAGTGLGSITTGSPIRFAEIRVLDSNNSIVQCAETDASGAFSLSVPRGTSSVTIQVNSRSYTSQVKASVLQDPNTNRFYSISTSAVPDSSKGVGTVTALADETQDSELKGGAFNILDQIYKANNFLLTNTGGAFSVTQKASIYWKRGVTPAVYANGSDTTPVSYYVPGTDAMYIQGGIQGDVCVSDTDHFDNSVIIHEYGHFLEDNYSVSDSPGGAHTGQFQIDPRLAWSEGFANFFSAIVLGNPTYVDTTGRPGSGCSTSISYQYNMETNTPAYDTIQAQTGIYPSNLGEGVYREWAIGRILWDATDSVNDSETVTMPFSEFWGIYTGNFKTQRPFRDMGSFLFFQASGGGATNISALLTSTVSTINGRMEANRKHYAREHLGGGTCSYSIRARDQTGKSENGSFANSNWFYSNDFLWVNHPGGTLTVSLSYTPTNKVDLDLYVYKEDYTFAVGADIVTSSTRDNGFDSSGSPISSNDGGSESVSVSLPAGNYLVNVNYYTGDGKDAGDFNATTYSITINGTTYCE